MSAAHHQHAGLQPDLKRKLRLHMRKFGIDGYDRQRFKVARATLLDLGRPLEFALRATNGNVPAALNLLVRGEDGDLE